MQSVFGNEEPVDVPIGPSPWACRGRSRTVNGISYRFQDIDSTGALCGITALQDSIGRTFLLLDFHCYVDFLDDGSVLLWRQSGDEKNRRIVFDCLNLTSLEPILEPRSVAADMRQRKLGISPMQRSEHWELSPELEAGTHSLSPPYDWSCFAETLVLGDIGESNYFDKASRAIFAFDWVQRIVQVFPQDWFNTGTYDFGYQWIARVARRSDGTIVGDGVRLGSFELDESNLRVRKWLTTNPFYRVT